MNMMAGGDLSFLSYKELLAQRALAERSVRRGRNVKASGLLLDRIAQELERRQVLKREARNRGTPRIDGFSR
ncbi:MAG: hypothetical protein AAF850_09145 [Pseudomonadota bacterium]